MISLQYYSYTVSEAVLDKRFCHWQVLSPARSVAVSLMTQATEKDTLNAHTEAKENGRALFVANL